jgi:ketosteroid isomerase-like protein
MYRGMLAGTVVAMGLAGCAPQEAPVSAAATVDTAAVVAGVNELWTRWSAADVAGDTEALIALSTPAIRMDAMGSAPIVGHDAARAAWTPIFQATDYTEATITPEMTVAVTNELAHSMGKYFSRFTANGRAGAEYGRYVAAAVKGADGQWRAAYIMAMIDSTVTAK